jgi:hypothetical protein
MWLTKILTTALVAWLGLLPSSCTRAKNSTAQKQAPAGQTASVDSTNKFLGELSLTNHYETCVNLGAGKSCTIKPVLMSHDNLQLTMSVESKNNKGKTQDLSVVQVVTKDGKPFEIAVGDMNLSLTPKLSDQ